MLCNPSPELDLPSLNGEENASVGLFNNLANENPPPEDLDPPVIIPPFTCFFGSNGVLDNTKGSTSFNSSFFVVSSTGPGTSTTSIPSGGWEGTCMGLAAAFAISSSFCRFFLNEKSFKDIRTFVAGA